MLPYLFLAGSVCAHVGWNLLARRHQPSSDFLWWAVVGYCLLTFPCLFQVVLWSADVWPYMLLTGVLNGIYFIALGQAYQTTPAAVAYPIARSSPIMLLTVEVGLLGVDLSAWSIVAIVIATSGILMLVRSLPKQDSFAGIKWALLAAVATTGYTLSDQRAAHGGIMNISAGLGYVCVTYGIAWLMMCGHRVATKNVLVPPRPPLIITLVAAVCVGVAYVLVIGALRFLPAAVTITWTNVGVVVGVLLAIIVLKERERMYLRLLAVCLTVVGLIMLSLL